MATNERLNVKDDETALILDALAYTVGRVEAFMDSYADRIEDFDAGVLDRLGRENTRRKAVFNRLAIARPEALARLEHDQGLYD